MKRFLSHHSKALPAKSEWMMFQVIFQKIKWILQDHTQTPTHPFPRTQTKHATLSEHYSFHDLSLRLLARKTLAPLHTLRAQLLFSFRSIAIPTNNPWRNLTRSLAARASHTKRLSLSVAVLASHGRPTCAALTVADPALPHLPAGVVAMTAIRHFTEEDC